MSPVTWPFCFCKPILKKWSTTAPSESHNGTRYAKIFTNYATSSGHNIMQLRKVASNFNFNVQLCSAYFAVLCFCNFTRFPPSVPNYLKEPAHKLITVWVAFLVAALSFDLDPPSLWYTGPVPSHLVPVEDPTWSDFRSSASLYLRATTTVFISSSNTQLHSNFFRPCYRDSNLPKLLAALLLKDWR